MYEILYKEFQNELGVAISSFVLWKKIRESTSNEKILYALNNTPRSWIIIRHSLQVTFFITLHNIFDTGKEKVSAENLLSECNDNINIFSKEKLKTRREKDFINSEELDEYIKKAYCPLPSDIQALRGELRKHRNTFNDIYRPIRNKLIAHKLVSHLDKSSELYEKTNIDEIENMLSFLNSLKNALFDLYVNGKKPDLSSYTLDTKHYENDYDKLIKSITKV